MIAWVVLVALAAPELTISHRRVDTADGVALALYRYRVGAQPNDSCPILLVPDLGFTRSAFEAPGETLITSPAGSLWSMLSITEPAIIDDEACGPCWMSGPALS